MHQSITLYAADANAWCHSSSRRQAEYADDVSGACPFLGSILDNRYVTPCLSFINTYNQFILKLAVYRPRLYRTQQVNMSPYMHPPCVSEVINKWSGHSFNQAWAKFKFKFGCFGKLRYLDFQVKTDA